MKNFLFHAKNLERRRIIETLLQAGNVPVVVIVAQMGYGKTTAVENFLEKKRECKKIWLALGQKEMNEGFLWTKLCVRLEEAGFPFASAMQENGLPENQYEIECMIDLVRNGFEQMTYLVLDDCHKCNSKKLLELVEYISCERIPNLQVILISRLRPDMRYGELWMKGSCILIEQDLLTMSSEEIAEFFEINGITVPQEDLDQILAYTEGWMAAVYLVLIDYKSNGKFRNLGGVNHLVYRFIYNDMPEEAKQILMKLSLFDSYTLDQAVYITQMESCRYLLPQMAENIGFVKYNSETECFSLHTVLRSVVGLEREKEKIPKEPLYELSAKWYEKSGRHIEAIHDYELAHKSDAVYRILNRHRDCGLYDQSGGIIKGFFQNGNKEEHLLHPIAYIYYIYKVVVYENYFEGKRMFEEVWEYYRTHECQEMSAKQIQGELYLMKCTIEFNNLELMAENIGIAYEMMEDKHSCIFSDLILTYGAPEMLFLYHSQPGKLKRTVEMAKKYTFYYSVLINGYEGGWDDLFDAEYDFTTGNVAAASLLAEWTCEKAVIREHTCVVVSAYFVRLRCLVHMGKREEFLSLMEELEQYMSRSERIAERMEYEITISYLYGCMGEIEKIASWIVDFKLENCNRMVRSVRSGCVCYGIVLLKKGQWMRLEALAEEMLVPYSVSKHVYAFIYAEIYYALAQYHLHGMERGLLHLQKCLELARCDGIKMPIVEYIEYLEPMLMELSKTNAYAAELLVLGAKQKAGIESCRKDGNFKKQELLTEREKEIMGFVCRGCTNQEISSELHLAIVTVEKKLTGIYRKLGVQNRAAAIVKLNQMK